MYKLLTFVVRILHKIEKLQEYVNDSISIPKNKK